MAASGAARRRGRVRRHGQVQLSAVPGGAADWRSRACRKSAQAVDRRLLLVPVVAAILVAPMRAGCSPSTERRHRGRSRRRERRPCGDAHTAGRCRPLRSRGWCDRRRDRPLSGARERCTTGLGRTGSLRTMLFAALLATIGAVLIGASNIGERYMYPILTIVRSICSRAWRATEWTGRGSAVCRRPSGSAVRRSRDRGR